MEVTPFIKKEQDRPLYLQLYYYFRDEIECGRLAAGTKLPSIRQLSQTINISKNTVDMAYQQLVAEGYIEGREKKGLFVLKLEDFSFGKRNGNQLVSDNAQHDSQQDQAFIDFQYGDIELERFPHRVWKKCLVESLDCPSQKIFSYGDKNGHSGLRREIAQYLHQARGVQCVSDQVILTAGTQTAIQLICQLLALRDQNVAMENPGYDGVRHVFENLQCQLRPIPLDEDGINIEELENSSAVCAYVTPSHQFPIGMVLPIQKRIKLLQWAQQNSSYIIEDDYDGEFRYQGQPIPSLKSLDTNGKVIYLGTFSKAFLPAARVSYLVLPMELMERFQTKLFFYNQTVSPLIQEALYQFMKNGHFSRHIRKMRKIYQSKQKALLEAIENYLGNRVKVIGQKAGLHLLLEWTGGDSRELVKKGEEAGVKIYLTEKYWFNDSPKGKQPIIIGYGGLTEEQIHLGIQRLANVLNACHK